MLYFFFYVKEIETWKTTHAALKGSDRRMFMAGVAMRLGYGALSFLEKYTVLLMPPDYVEDMSSHQTICVYVTEQSVDQAIDAAQKAACEEDGQNTPEDYHCLFCTERHVAMQQPKKPSRTLHLMHKWRGPQSYIQSRLWWCP